MTFITSAQTIARTTGKDWRSHLLPILSGGALAVAALAFVAYLLWPTWEVDPASGPARLPVSVGSTLFNVPSGSIRMKIQHHTGPQERIDLNFAYPVARTSGSAKARHRRRCGRRHAADRPDFPVDRGTS